MQIDYQCADCNAVFPVTISQREIRTTISGARDDSCPDCRQRVGYGEVRCEHCGEAFVARMPLRHTASRMCFGKCPRCRETHLRPVEADTASAR